MVLRINAMNIKKNNIKRILPFLIISVILTGCSNIKELQAQNESLSEQVQILTSEKESLSSELTSVQNDYDKINKELELINESIAESKEAEKVQSSDVEIIVTNKDQRPKDIYTGQYNDYCALTFQVTNNTDKDIQGIEGGLIVSDLFGKEIMRVGCDFTGQIIKSKQSITEDELGFEVNPFIDEDMKFYNTDFKDLKFEYIVHQIVFTDGTVKK